MLTADLIDVRRRGDELALVAFAGARRELATELAGAMLAVARAQVGSSRDVVEHALAAVAAPSRARRLALALRKILDDDASWEGATGLDPVALRRAVFERAAAVRAALGDDERLDREAVLAEVAPGLGLDAGALERALFSDLRAAEVLRGLDLHSAEAIVERYARQQVQAVLLRAVRVRVHLRCDSPGAYRALFRQVKFLRLLYALREAEDGGYELEVDGPFSLFESVTKYGLQLALLLPVLEGARSYRLEADVRWGREGRALRFKHEGGGGAPVAARPLSDDAQALLDALVRAETPWRARRADSILALPGVGLCVPDLRLEHRETGEVVHVELLGFWSREAVFRRKELVERGLADRIVFAVSSQLRVREELLDDDCAGALYVYKRVPAARVLLERVEALAARRIRG